MSRERASIWITVQVAWSCSDFRAEIRVCHTLRKTHETWQADILPVGSYHSPVWGQPSWARDLIAHNHVKLGTPNNTGMSL